MLFDYFFFGIVHNTSHSDEYKVSSPSALVSSQYLSKRCFLPNVIRNGPEGSQRKKKVGRKKGFATPGLEPVSQRTIGARHAH